MDTIIFSGKVTLTNTKQYPFNNSTQTVAFIKSMRNQDYPVYPEVIGNSGNVGDVIISDKDVNGFKIAFTGSARQVVILYRVIEWDNV